MSYRPCKQSNNRSKLIIIVIVDLCSSTSTIVNEHAYGTIQLIGVIHNILHELLLFLQSVIYFSTFAQNL